MPPPKQKHSRMVSLINYRLRVTLNDSRQLVGQMLAFDKHMNLVLVDTEEFRRLKGAKQPEGAEMKRTLGLVILRGESIVSLSVEGPPPVKDEKEIAPGPGIGMPAGRGMGMMAPGGGAAPPAFAARPMPYGAPPPGFPGMPGAPPGFRPPPGFPGAPPPAFPGAPPPGFPPAGFPPRPPQ